MHHYVLPEIHPEIGCIISSTNYSCNSFKQFLSNLSNSGYYKIFLELSNHQVQQQLFQPFLYKFFSRTFFNFFFFQKIPPQNPAGLYPGIQFIMCSMIILDLTFRKTSQTSSEAKKFFPRSLKESIRHLYRIFIIDYYRIYFSDPGFLQISPIMS